VIVAGRKRHEIAADLLRRDPNCLVAFPASGEHVVCEPSQQVCGERRLLQGESVIGTRNDHERAVGNLHAQRLVQRARRQEVELAIQDHRRHPDRRQFRRQRLEVEEGLHQVLQRVDVVDEPPLVLHAVELVQDWAQPFIRDVHRQQQVLEIACAAENQAGA